MTTGMPWILGSSGRSGRTTSTIDWPLINDERDPSCVKLELNDGASPADLSEGSRVASADGPCRDPGDELHLQGPATNRAASRRRSHAIPSNRSSNDLHRGRTMSTSWCTSRPGRLTTCWSSVAGPIRSPRSPPRSMICRHRCWICWRYPRPPTSRAVSVLDGMDPRREPGGLAQPCTEAAQDLIDAAVESVQDGNDEARDTWSTG